MKEALVLAWSRDESDGLKVTFRAYGTRAIVRVSPGDGSPPVLPGEYRYSAPGIYTARASATIDNQHAAAAVQVLVEELEQPAEPQPKRKRKAAETSEEDA